MKSHRSSTGMTLVECLIFLVLMMGIASMTLISVGQSRVLRGNARERLRLLMVAQEQLDAACARHDLEPGATSAALDGEPTVTVATDITAHPGGGWVVAVTVSREAAQGLPPVTLASWRPAGGAP